MTQAKTQFAEKVAHWDLKMAELNLLHGPGYMGQKVRP